jgi:hypothetical protein
MTCAKRSEFQWMFQEVVTCQFVQQISFTGTHTKWKTLSMWKGLWWWKLYVCGHTIAIAFHSCQVGFEIIYLVKLTKKSKSSKGTELTTGFCALQEFMILDTLILCKVRSSNFWGLFGDVIVRYPSEHRLWGFKLLCHKWEALLGYPILSNEKGTHCSQPSTKFGFFLFSVHTTLKVVPKFLFNRNARIYAIWR